MKDGLVRRQVKRIGLGVYHARLFLHRLQTDTRYELGGECIRCGKCCEEPGIQVGRIAWYLPGCRRVFLWWHRVVNGFTLKEARREDCVFIFERSHFDWASRSCDSYPSRPGMCRDYPRLFLEQANPEFFDECGFKALARGRDSLIQILEKESLTPQQLAKLKKGLYLGD